MSCYISTGVLRQAAQRAGCLLLVGATDHVGGTTRAIQVAFTLPRVPALEYHRPYVALWIERANHTGFRTLALWYDKRKTGADAEKYLSGLREWWRRGGERLSLPADGISGATRAPGAQTIAVSDRQIASLPPGHYQLALEAAREVGGDEVVRLPLDLPTNGGVATKSGNREIGAVEITAKR